MTRLLPSLTGAVALLLTLCACSGGGDDLVGGSVTETGNALTKKSPSLVGLLQEATGGAIAGATVNLFTQPADSIFDGTLIIATKTDRSGAFKFYGIPGGRYYLLCDASSNPSLPFVQNVIISPGSTTKLGSIRLFTTNP